MGRGSLGGQLEGWLPQNLFPEFPGELLHLPTTLSVFLPLRGSLLHCPTDISGIISQINHLHTNPYLRAYLWDPQTKTQSETLN